MISLPWRFFQQKQKFAKVELIHPSESHGQHPRKIPRDVFNLWFINNQRNWNSCCSAVEMYSRFVQIWAPDVLLELDDALDHTSSVVSLWPLLAFPREQMGTKWSFNQDHSRQTRSGAMTDGDGEILLCKQIPHQVQEVSRRGFIVMVRGISEWRFVRTK